QRETAYVGVSEVTRLADADRQNIHARHSGAVAVGTRDPLAVGRKRSRAAVTEANGGRAVGLADVRAVSRLFSFAALAEDDRFTVGRDVGNERPIEPAERAGRSIVVPADHGHFHALIVLCEERAAVFCHVEKNHRTGRGGHAALAAVKRDGKKRSRGSRYGSREVNLVAVPGEAASAGPSLREFFLVSGEIDDGDRAAVVA